MALLLPFPMALTFQLAFPFVNTILSYCFLHRPNFAMATWRQCCENLFVQRFQPLGTWAIWTKTVSATVVISFQNMELIQAYIKRRALCSAELALNCSQLEVLARKEWEGKLNMRHPGCCRWVMDPAHFLHSLIGFAVLWHLNHQSSHGRIRGA